MPVKKLMNTILVTGGAGFIGSHYVRYLLDNYDTRVINLDCLSYSSNLANLSGFEQNPNYTFIKANLANREDVELIFQEDIHEVVHFAAESHVDRSIQGPDPFIQSNILGTYHLLEAARQNNIKKFVHISTDEVYGSIPTGSVDEKGRLNPGNPYSASKASSDMLCLSYVKTYNLPGVITRCTNNYGPNQHPEKFIPRSISLLKKGNPIYIYGDGNQERDWLHVTDHVKAVDRVRINGRVGEVYHIGAENPMSNISIAQKILVRMGKPHSMLEHVEDRLGHDTRYSLDTSKIRGELGWRPQVSLEKGLEETVSWYVENENWWRSVSFGDRI